MNILYPDIHKSLTNSFAKALKKLGHTFLIPAYEPTHYPPPPVKPFVWNSSWTDQSAKAFFETDNFKILKTKEEVIAAKPDVVFITAYENQFEIHKEILPHLPKAKLVHYSGNDYWEGAYPIDTIKNYLCADYTGFSIAYKYNKHYLWYRPWVDYERFPFKSTSDNKLIGCYIADYASTFPPDYLTFMQIQDYIKKNLGINFDVHDSSTREQVADSLQKVACSVHVKRLEGYGYSMIQSAATGRPVFIPKQYKKYKAFENWMIDKKTCIYFTDAQNLLSELALFFGNENYRHEFQTTCAESIRKSIDNEEQTENLGKFLQNLR